MSTLEDLHIHINRLITIIINCPFDIPQIVRSATTDVRKGVLHIGRFLNPKSKRVVSFRNAVDVYRLVEKMVQFRNVLVTFMYHVLPELGVHEANHLDEYVLYSIRFLKRYVT